MKKILFCMMAAVAFLSSCDPVEDSYSNNAKNVAEGDLASIVTFTQTDENGNAQADGNYFTFTTSPATVVDIYTFRADSSENLLSHGVASGSFKYAPSRGSDPNQTLYLRAMNSDGSLTESSKSVVVFVPGELDPQVKLLASNDYGSKTWKWDPTINEDGAVWGNMGYCGGSGADVGISGNGKWWGVTSSEEFNGQLQHTHNGKNNGDGDFDAYMVFSEDGLLTSYTKDGDVIRTGTFAVEGYTGSYTENGWKLGDLKTDAILWPYEINSGGNIPGTYEIVYLTADKMTLVYPDGGAYDGLGNWGEATYWHFASKSDLLGMAAGYENGKDWTWDPSVNEDGAVWGNMGYCGGSGADVGISGNGKWWGVTSTEEFNGQLQHTNTGANAGDGDLNAWMTIGTDGMITSYAADGSVVRSGTYELNPVENSDWKVAELKTNAILWPFEINSGGNIPGIYEVVYLTSDKMTLVYPDGGDFSTNGGWGEATYWHFKAKK